MAVGDDTETFCDYASENNKMFLLSGGYFSRLSATTRDLRGVLAEGYEFFRNGSVYGFSQNNVAEEVLIAPKTLAADITVSYAANGGIGEMDPGQIKLGNKFSPPECTFVRDGYVFSGWNTDAKGNGKSYTPGTTSMITENITLYAQWTKKTEYNVIFDANGGEGQMSPQTFYAGAAKETAKADTVSAKSPDDSKSPQTGDNSSLIQWFALLLVIGGTVVGMTAYSQKKRHFVK